MEKHILMDISNGGLLYQIFYLLAFLIAYSILIHEGYRRKFPIAAWILMLASIRLAVLTGTKIFSFTPGEWQYMMDNHLLLPNHEKTMFGGFLLGILVYFIAKHILAFRHSAWDAVAIAMPAAVSVQTIGCFFYGCCFGKPSSLPWAVQYPVMSLAHYHQFESGLISNNDLYSLPVHPVQLYHCIAGILVIVLVMRFRKYWKANGSILLSSLIFFALARFIIEFFRDPLSNKSGGEMLWILKQVQWKYISFAVLMSVLLFLSEKRPVIKKVIYSENFPSLKLQISFISVLILIMLLLRHWFSFPEIIALNIALLPAIFISGINVVRSFKTLKYKCIYAFAVILPFIMMSQTLPSEETDTAGAEKIKTYHTIGGGIATGEFIDAPTYFSGDGCDRVTNTRYFNQKYTAEGIGYIYTKETPGKEIIRYGVNVYYGEYSQTALFNNHTEDNKLYGVNPFAGIDSKWFGGKIGVHLGNLYYTTGDRKKETTEIPLTSNFYTPIFLLGNLLLGEIRTFFGEVRIADQFPVSVPGLAFQFNIGTGLGLKNGFNLRIGTSLMDHNGWLFSGYIPIDNRVVVEPLFLWSSGGDDPGYPGHKPENQFSLGLSYRFGHK